MPRKLTTVEQERVNVVGKLIGVTAKDPCDLVYTPDIVRALAVNLDLSPEESFQAIRDLLSLNLLEMHFDQDLSPVSKEDKPFVFPAPAWTSKKNFSPYPLPYLRVAQKPSSAPCGVDRCGANAPDFTQPDLFLSGSFTFEKQTHKVNVNLRDYDIIAVNSSGGKDSQAMLDAVYRECRRQGIEDRIHVYFADLESAEWPGTADIAELQTQYYGVAFDAVRRPQGDLVERIKQKGEWPGAQFRYCTSDLKRGQISRLFTRDSKAVRDAIKEEGKPMRPARILNCLGIRAQESPGRAKKRPFRPNHPDYSSGEVRHVDAWYPIFRWTNVDVWETIARSGVPHHWAYDVGMPRLSCVFCIMGDTNSLLLGGIYNPELLDTYVDMELSFKAMGQSVGRVEKGKGVRASQFTKDNSIESVRDAIERGERPSGEIDVQS